MTPFLLDAPLSLPTSILAYGAAAALGGIGALGLLAPTRGARVFGVSVNDQAGASFVQAMGARNLGLTLTAAALTAMGLRSGLAALVAAAALMAALDAVIVLRASGLHAAAKHIAYAPAFTAFALWIASGR